VPADLSSMDGSYVSAGYMNRVECAHLSTTLVSQTYPRKHAVVVAMLLACHISIACTQTTYPAAYRTLVSCCCTNLPVPIGLTVSCDIEMPCNRRY
jgi:hypothetical protein